LSPQSGAFSVNGYLLSCWGPLSAHKNAPLLLICDDFYSRALGYYELDDIADAAMFLNRMPEWLIKVQAILISATNSHNFNEATIGKLCDDILDRAFSNANLISNLAQNQPFVHRQC